MESGGETPCLRRQRRARWFLDEGDADAAAAELEAGDDFPLGEAEFPALAQALFRRGLAALYEEGQASVCSWDEAELVVVARIRRRQQAAPAPKPP
jgi:hypothetical protein